MQHGHPAPCAPAPPMQTYGHVPATAVCVCCQTTHAIHARALLNVKDPQPGNGNPPAAYPHMTQVQAGHNSWWLCEMCTKWVCYKCGKLELELAHPSFEHFQLKRAHDYPCLVPAQPGVATAPQTYFGEDDIGLDVWQRPGAVQCLTCQHALMNLEKQCAACGKVHSVTKNGVKVVDYLSGGSHMFLRSGEWYCEFCVVVICGRCGKSDLEPENASKNLWAQARAHDGSQECQPLPAGILVGQTFYIDRKNLVNRARNHAAVHCNACQAKLVKWPKCGFPKHELDPTRVSTTDQLKQWGTTLWKLLKGLNSLENSGQGGATYQ